MLSSLSVFFPCYNEEKNIHELIESARAYLPSIAKKFEIIIVDDGSIDQTRTVVTKLQPQCKELRLISHTHNKGYGAALKTGIAASQYEWTFWMDGDLQFQIRSLDAFLAQTEQHDAIIGYRAHRADTFLRKVNGELYTRLINFLFGLHIRDIDCAFKLIKTSRLHAFAIETESAFTSAEILINLKRHGVECVQLPVPHFPRKHGSPTGGSLQVILKGLHQTVVFFLRSRHL